MIREGGTGTPSQKQDGGLLPAKASLVEFWEERVTVSSHRHLMHFD